MLLEKFIKQILVERSSDIAASKFSNEIINDIIDTIKLVNLKSYDLDNRKYWLISLSDLGLMVPARIKQLKVGIKIDSNSNANASFIFPDDDLPQGAIVINNADAPKKVTGDYVSRLFKSKKTSLFHELTHAWDFLIGPFSFDKAKDYSIDQVLNLGDYSNTEEKNKKYYSLEHEKNAYLRQAFQKFLDSSISNNLKLNHKQVWNEVYKFFPNDWQINYSEEQLLKKFGARVAEMWENYLTNLAKDDE
jgi:hypothetical protein